MAHEIEQHDGVVLHREKAWHGLGTVVQDAPTPREALQLAGLDWECEQWSLSATNGESRIICEKNVANVRSDTKTILGVVGKDWTPIQNREAAAFCAALAEGEDTVRLESAGSIRNGQKVWFLMKGESFSQREDEIVPYILCSNGFDGGTGFRCTPTTIRVVCSNTLHMVIPKWDSESGRMRKLAERSFVAKHTSGLLQRVEEAKKALSLYGKSLEEQRGLIDTLAAKDVSREDVRRFFLECYTRDFGGIADTPTTAAERKHRDKAMTAFRKVEQRFERENGLAGSNMWTLFNAYSGYVQHDNASRLTDLAKREEARIGGALFGVSQERTIHAFGVALNAAV